MRAAIVGTFVIMLGFGVLSPILPLYARTFGVGLDAVGVLIAAFSITRLACDPFTGWLIDRFGERRLVAWGATIVGLSSALAALAPTFGLLVVLRGAGGAGSAVFFAGLWSFLLKTVPRDRVGRVMSVWYASFNVGIIAGEPLGGLFAKWLGPASALWIYAGTCLVSAALFSRSIRDPERALRTAGDPPRGLRGLRFDRPFLTVLCVNVAYTWVLAGVYSTLIPLFGHERVGLSSFGVGVGLALASITEFAVLFPAGKATDHAGRKAVLVPSFAAMIAALVLLGAASTTAVFMAALGVFGIITGYAGVPPAPMLADLSTEATRGTAVAVFRFVGDLGFVLGPFVAGFTADHLGYARAFAISAVPSALALGLVLSIHDTMPRFPRTGEAPGL